MSVPDSVFIKIDVIPIIAKAYIAVMLNNFLSLKMVQKIRGNINEHSITI